nr:helix-hairpin-helix domain-containing protein [Desulfobulbaceae bacterium]
MPLSLFTVLTKTARTFLLLLSVTLSADYAFALEGTLNPNTASSKELEQLPFIGKAKAKALVKCRTQNKQFSSLDEIQQCPEIGQSTFEAIRPYLSLTGSTTLNKKEPPDATPAPEAAYRFVPRINTRPGEIKILADSTYYDTLLNFINYAEDRITITIFVFKTTSSPKNRPSLVIQALTQAKKRGVAITVLLERSDYDDNLNKENENTAKLLRKKGIKVRFDSPKATTHSKIVVIDNRFCFVGSHNFTHSALAYNNELSLLVDSTLLAQELQRYMQAIK